MNNMQRKTQSISGKTPVSKAANKKGNTTVPKTSTTDVKTKSKPPSKIDMKKILRAIMILAVACTLIFASLYFVYRGREDNPFASITDSDNDGFVDNPKKIKIKETKLNSQTTLSLKVETEDMGKVIGKKGKIIKAVRQLVRVKAFRVGERVNLILEENRVRE